MSETHPCPKAADDFLADRILLSAIGSATPSGLFLVCPHAEGGLKAIEQRLRRALEIKGAWVVCANLADEQQDPGSIISKAIGVEVHRHYARLSPGTLDAGHLADFSPESVGVGREVSLTDALVALSILLKVTIVLIIDEARFVMTTENASATMHALKAARDELNSSKHSGLRIVFMDWDKQSLMHLCGNWDQPFYGAPMIEMPDFR